MLMGKAIWGSGVRFADRGGCCRAPKWGLKTMCHRHTMGDSSNEGRDASWRVEMGNVDSRYLVFRGDGFHTRWVAALVGGWTIRVPNALTAPQVVSDGLDLAVG